MSHFTVLVIGENVEEQLAPYHEFECTGCDDKYIEDIDETEEVKEAYKKHKKEYSSLTDFSKEYYGREPVKEKDLDINDSKYKYGYTLVNEKGKVIKIISRTNPNSKWDWYVVGGRWAGSLKLKKDVAKSKYNDPNFSWGWDKESKKEVLEKDVVDSARKKDIDFSRDEEKYKKAERFWELKIEKQEPKTEEDKEMLKFDFYKEEYYLKRYKDKKTFATLRSEFSTHAVIKNGEWIEQGEMGWFGCHSATPDQESKWDKGFFHRFICKLPDNTLLTVVDCHI